MCTAAACSIWTISQTMVSVWSTATEALRLEHQSISLCTYIVLDKLEYRTPIHRLPINPEVLPSSRSRLATIDSSFWAFSLSPPTILVGDIISNGNQAKYSPMSNCAQIPNGTQLVKTTHVWSS
ncbi:hypothetical protein EDD18DRAFT_243055 [Armillaria luteobubalina]|uniref:Uncharacterized protein n=1 Tax=Armillaria luteobubalina TaxID=153913 RepID=A0AA39TN32_9AGAR|nr:hypothetical protein EDD18DRAFT_243055 [Armillaria luteobubalina]